MKRQYISWEKESFADSVKFAAEKDGFFADLLSELKLKELKLKKLSFMDCIVLLSKMSRFHL